MTREEAIEYLNTLYMALAVFPNQQISLGNVDEMKESVSMAIQALEKENIYDDGEHYVTISKALYDKLNIDYEALSQEPCDAVSRILTKMWNCRGKHTTSIDKVAMEQIIRDELSSVTSKPIECDDTVSRGVFEQVMKERDIAIEQLHELGYEWGQKIEPLEVEAAKLQQAYDKGFEDCRQAVLDLINADWEYEGLEVPVNSLLPVTQNPETVTEFADRCRECGARYGKLLKQKSGKWIPCSERLPEKSDRYLAYIVNRHDDKLQYIMTCDYSVDGYWNWFPDAESASDNVIAWMPLPKPFEPQERSEQV